MGQKAAIGWLNRVDGDATVLSAGSADAQRPVSNLADVQPTNKWRTENMSNTYFDCDFGSQVTLRAIALIATNLTPTATLRVQLSNTAAGNTDIADSGVVNAGLLSDTEGLIDPPKNALYLFSSEQTARYCRVTLADAALSTYIEVGRAFIGPVWQPTRNFDLGFEPGWDDSSADQESDGGQSFVDEKSIRRTFSCAFRRVSEDDAFNEAWKLLGSVGRRKDILLIPRPDSSHLAKEWLFGRLDTLSRIGNRNLDMYEVSFLVKERK